MQIDVEQVVREYIDKTYHLSLATVSGGKPWVCEVHFAYDENLNLYFRSLKSRRHSQEIAGNPNVAGNIIDTYDLGQSVVGVYFEGKAELLTDRAEKEHADECIRERLKIDADLLAEAEDENGHQYYKISVSNWCIFGRFGGDHGQKFELAWNGGSE